MNTEQLERKLQRIILDLRDFRDEPYLDSESEAKVKAAIIDLSNITVYSTEV